MLNEYDNPKMEDHSVLRYFKDIFADEIPELSPRREIDLSIGLVPVCASVSKAPYKMSILELTQLKIQIQELLDKGYIKPNVSPWGAPILFFKKKDGTFRLCINY